MGEYTFGVPAGPWFRWFAWHPTYTTDRGWRWFRFVWKRRIVLKRHLPPSGGDMWWQTSCSKEAATWVEWV